jgi:hypothetical protein
MKVIVNGFPRSGTHALLKAIQLLGIPAANEPFDEGVIAVHFGSKEKIPKGVKHICIFRHPKNCLISECRFMGKPLASGFLIGFIKNFRDGRLMKEMLSQYLGWKKKAYCVSYEDLVKDDKCLREIAKYLQVPYLEDAFPNLPGLTFTWSGKPSNWEEHWNDEIEKVWVESGMNELQTKLGYGTTN